MIVYKGKAVIIVGIDERGELATVHYVEAFGKSDVVPVKDLRPDTRRGRGLHQEPLLHRGSPALQTKQPTYVRVADCVETGEETHMTDQYYIGQIVMLRRDRGPREMWRARVLWVEDGVPTICVDVDQDGKPIGCELRYPSRPWHVSALTAEES